MTACCRHKPNQTRLRHILNLEKEEQIMKLIQELTNEMKSLDRRVDARINGIVQRGGDTRPNPQR